MGGVKPSLKIRDPRYASTSGHLAGRAQRLSAGGLHSHAQVLGNELGAGHNGDILRRTQWGSSYGDLASPRVLPGLAHKDAIGTALSRAAVRTAAFKVCICMILRLMSY